MKIFNELYLKFFIRILYILWIKETLIFSNYTTDNMLMISLEVF